MELLKKQDKKENQLVTQFRKAQFELAKK